MKLSSPRGENRRVLSGGRAVDVGCGIGCGVGLLVAEHGPLNVETTACERDDCLHVCLALAAFALVVDLRDGIAVYCNLRGEITGTQQSAAVVPRPVQVAADPAGVAGNWCQARDASEAVDGAEDGHVAAGGGEELCGQDGPEAGHAGQDFGVRVAAKSVLDQRFGVADFAVEVITSLANRATICAATC